MKEIEVMSDLVGKGRRIGHAPHAIVIHHHSLNISLRKACLAAKAIRLVK